MTTYCDLPMIECPHCGHEWQYDDYYDLGSGDEIGCPKCERAIHVLSIDTTISVRLGVSA